MPSERSRVHDTVQLYMYVENWPLLVCSIWAGGASNSPNRTIRAQQCSGNICVTTWDCDRFQIAPGLSVDALRVSHGGRCAVRRGKYAAPGGTVQRGVDAK